MVADATVSLRISQLVSKHREEPVEASLSVAAAMANDVQQAANQTLATVGRPGIAVDMAKMRDVVQRSAALFAGCTAPR
jgi:hypothetical protein